MIYPLHVRWLAVWKRVFGGKTWRTIGRHLSEASIGQKGPTKSTMKRWVKRYKLYGDVADDARKKGGNLLFTRRRDLTLLKILADSPGDMLVEIRRKFIRRTGVRPAISTVCQAPGGASPRLESQAGPLSACSSRLNPQSRRTVTRPLYGCLHLTAAAHLRRRVPRGSSEPTSASAAPASRTSSGRRSCAATARSSSSFGMRQLRTSAPCAGAVYPLSWPAPRQDPNLQLRPTCAGRSDTRRSARRQSPWESSTTAAPATRLASQWTRTASSPGSTLPERSIASASSTPLVGW